MKIINIVIDNTKIIRCFRAKLDGKNLHVAGDVSEGKTTAISALWDIIEKKGDSITHGEKKGCVRIILEGNGKRIIAERLTKASVSTLKIIDQDGDKITAQDFKGMISALAVDPHKIMSMKGAEQVKTLLSAASVDMDLEKADEEIAKIEADRLAAHQKVDALKPGDEPEKAEAVDVSALIKERDEATQKNQKNQTSRENLSNLKQEKAEFDSTIHKLKTQLEKEEKELAEIKENIIASTDVCAMLVDADTKALDEQIESSTATNTKANLHDAWVLRSESFEKAQAAHKELDESVREKKQAKVDALETAKWPLEGLAVEDGKVIYNGNLLSNLGESEQMLVCCALAIKDIKAHELKVVRLDGVESMSQEHLGAMVKMFNDEDIQVLSTRVSRGEIEPEEIQIVEGVYKDMEAAAK